MLVLSYLLLIATEGFKHSFKLVGNTVGYITVGYLHQIFELKDLHEFIATRMEKIYSCPGFGLNKVANNG